MTYKHRFHLLVLVIFVSGCAAPVVNVTEHQKANFSTSNTITVMCKTYDPLNIQGELEHLLLAKGYDVVSEDVAVRKAKSDIDMNYNNNRAQGGIESYNTTELRSVYALTFSYSDVWNGLLFGNQVKKLYGSLIDLRTGKVVKSLKIDRKSSYKSDSAFLEELVNRMQ